MAVRNDAGDGWSSGMGVPDVTIGTIVWYQTKRLSRVPSKLPAVVFSVKEKEKKGKAGSGKEKDVKTLRRTEKAIVSFYVFGVNVSEKIELRAQQLHGLERYAPPFKRNTERFPRIPADDAVAIFVKKRAHALGLAHYQNSDTESMYRALIEETGIEWQRYEDVRLASIASRRKIQAQSESLPQPQSQPQPQPQPHQHQNENQNQNQIKVQHHGEHSLKLSKQPSKQLENPQRSGSEPEREAVHEMVARLGQQVQQLAEHLQAQSGKVQRNGQRQPTGNKDGLEKTISHLELQLARKEREKEALRLTLVQKEQELGALRRMLAEHEGQERAVTYSEVAQPAGQQSARKPRAATRKKDKTPHAQLFVAANELIALPEWAGEVP